MSAEVAAAVRTWKAGEYTCTLTVPKPERGVVRSAAIEWSPEQPARLTPAEAAAYRAGRNAALADLAAEIGARVAVVEL